MPITRRALAQAALAAVGTKLLQADLAGPGIWHFRLGTPERITPTSTRNYRPDEKGLAELPRVTQSPVTPVGGGTSRRGFRFRIPLEGDEQLYGFGLQLRSFMQRGLKRTLRVNADPVGSSGDSHAPVPFYVSTRGYGVFIDTARYAVVYPGGKPTKQSSKNEVVVEVPVAEGVDVYVFGGPAMRDAVQRYNLFSGGGPLPPRWGLGFWYRCHLESDHNRIVEVGRELREARIPCDVLGLEPGWQTHAYPCSFVWSNKFPDPAAMMKRLAADHYRINLWEHAYTHASSPIHDPLAPYSADYLVWEGLAPDFTRPQAREIFGKFHDERHVALGASGYKLDECDNSDYTGGWSFPELSRFPSGADGEQMHSLFGLRYQDAIQGVFEARKQPTYGLVRSSGALAAPYPYVLYSDLYDHREFIRGVVNAGFSGLLWCPEVRDARDPEDLIRRLQTVVFSPLAMVNAWYIKNPPWKQVEQNANNAGQFMPGWEDLEAKCREIITWRMRFIPYLHAAFVKYQRTGLPPFRALVMDWPGDAQTHKIDDQYMMGDSILVAPVVAGQKERDVYLPQGNWYDFWTGERTAGGQKIRVAPPLERIPVYVKAGTLLPLAEPTLHTEDEGAWKLEVRRYGPNASPTVLYEHAAPVSIEWQNIRRSPAPGPQYDVIRWTAVDQR